jgi:hypothetical protein
MSDKLERVLVRTLRDLPSRTAPGTLEARVLGELQRRASQPWWRRSFAHWPMPARMAFVAVCIGFIGLGLLGGDWTTTTVGILHPALVLTVLPSHQALGLLSVAIALADVPTRVISPLWLYSALAAAAALYGTLFGLSAFAYRTLYLTPHGGR